uniref:DUF1156 domain-containing protein n=1 Tax=Kingella denitrificans TaxID=502 RepID=UPI0028E95727
REKSIRHGHPSTLHLWWARRPLAAARAVIFAQMVNDPGYQRELGRGVNKHEAEARRARLFAIIRDLVKWENTDNEEVLQRARDAIRESWRETCHLNRHHPQAATLYNPDELPGFHDPFAGGGALPLEAQRLGLAAHASDLNPVAVMINKAMIEIPPRFAGRAPIGPIPAEEKQKKLPQNWQGAQGLAEDVRRYGHWLRHEAERRIGQYYPKIRITAELAAERPDLKPLIGQELTVIAWLWARTVNSPNPAFAGCQVPLAASFVLSSKKGKEAWVAPQIDGKHYRFTVKTGTPPEEAKNGTKAARGANFFCILSGTPLDEAHIRNEFKTGKAGSRLLAIVAEGKKGRIYLPPTEEMENIAQSVQPEWQPEATLPDNPRWFSPPLYGMQTYGSLFTPRQLLALTTFSDLIDEARTKIAADYRAAHPASADDDTPLAAGGSGAQAYADAVAVYLAFAVDKASDAWSSITSWTAQRDTLRNTFARQAIPMVWDFAEVNPFSDSTGNFSGSIEWINKAIALFPAFPNSFANQADAQTQSLSQDKIISTDPPYYDNIGYADLSDFFYVWLRRNLRDIYPQLFATLATPKDDELVATPYRHGGKEAAERFFLDGMSEAMHRLAVQAHPAFPVTIYYAFKQAETKEDATASTGWETFLQAVIHAGFAITGTWPIRTERSARTVGLDTNALASSVVLVCRPRAADAPTASRGDFLRELKAIMPEALEAMLGGSGASPVTPVDLAQAAIGPGMEAFSRYAQVLESNGAAMGVREALVLINRAIDSYFEEEGAGDADSGFCMAWFKQYGWSSASFGDADTLARAKGTAVASVERSGVLEAGGGKVRLRKWQEYPDDWQPGRDDKTPVWEACHHLVRLLNQQGEHAAGAALAALRAQGDAIYRLAYQLYTLCERKKRAEDARYYNELIAAWPQISAAALEAQAQVKQPSLDL